MQNLDQIRAAAALKAADRTSRQAVSKLPAMIMANGLLAATAFATETNDKGHPKREKMKLAMDDAADHLAKVVHGIGVLLGCTTAAAMVKALSEAPATSTDLQRATAETLAFLAYLKRFTTKEEKEP